MDLLIFLALCCALAGALVGRSRGLTLAGFLAGLFFGPLGVLLTALSKPKRQRKCPACAEQIRSEAKVCRFCYTPIAAPAA